MKTSNNPSKRPLTLRDLERLTHYTYEHLRKVVSEGRPVASRKLSDRLSEVLGLEKRQMWKLAEQEKKQRAVRRLGTSPLADADIRLAALWRDLTSEQREAVCSLAADFIRHPTGEQPTSSCYIVTVKRNVLVVAPSSAVARQRASRQSAGFKVTSVSRLADASWVPGTDVKDLEVAQ